ncbi:MAG: nucleotide exchange factor GrpE [Inquilinus sp.]|nr:nucleotide exchange factor GrpE [Inquilinus sp.]
MPAPVEDAAPAPAAEGKAEATGEPSTGEPSAGEPAAAQPGAGQPRGEAPSPEAVIARLRAEAETLRDQMLRALADAENTRRRAEKAQQDTAKYAIADFARDILSTADNLRRALDAVPEDGISGEAVLKTLTEGVAATEQGLLGCFEKFGVRRIEALDQRFDPNLHQAMFEVPDTGKESGTVVQVIQDGYVIHDRLLRPALVGVAKAAPAQKVDTTA